MTTRVSEPEPTSSEGSLLTVRTHHDSSYGVVALSGELDLASRAEALQACTSTELLDVRVDLSALTFMDCAGYEALDLSASILHGRGGSLVLMNVAGEPRRLLALIDEVEPGALRPR